MLIYGSLEDMHVTAELFVLVLPWHLGNLADSVPGLTL